MSNNIGLLHKECGDKRKQEWQSNNIGLLIDINTNCKIAFEQDGTTEHMWVLVDTLDHDKKEYSGTLNNDPRFITNIKCNDIVKFKFEDIEDYLK